MVQTHAGQEPLLLLLLGCLLLARAGREPNRTLAQERDEAHSKRPMEAEPLPQAPAAAG